jgi:hypothetical protein
MNAYVHAVLTEQTCGEACWHAKEEICRCSCGGKNHGVLRAAEGEQPIRACKIDGIRYELLAVGPGREMRSQVNTLLRELPPHTVTPVHGCNGVDAVYKYFWKETDKGSPFRMKPATPIQAHHWPELSAYANLDLFDFRVKVCPALIWKRIG